MIIPNNNLDYTTPSTLEWNGLSMKDKAAFIRLAVAAGYKNIDDIRQLYKELNDINLFDRGGSKERHRFTPSKAVRDRISKWEGNTMVKDTVDPLSGKLVKRNNSFENEAAAFVNAIPPALRRTVLSNLDLADHLYSYSYNVGAGRFKERVVPKLIDYYNGKATIDDVTNSMWAAGDAKLKGLRLRREVEKEGVRNALLNMINPYTTSSVVELPVDAVRISMPVDPVTPYTAPKVIDASIFNQPLRQYFKYTPEYLINQAGKIIIPESSINTAVPLTATEILKLLELLKLQLRKTLLNLELEDSLYANGGNLFEDGGDTIDVEGYPLVSSNSVGLTEWFEDNPSVAGMAIGAGLNGIEGERRVVLNPALKDLDARNSIYQNESYRHFFDTNNTPLPPITDAQREAYIGTPYEGLDRRIQETEAARYLSGDPSHNLNEEQKTQLSKFRFTYPGGTLPEVTITGKKKALGGNLFEDGGNTDYVANYDDVYGARYGILPEVIVTPKGMPNVIRPKVDEKQWQKYWGDEGAASVSRGMNDAAPYVMEGMSMLVGNPIGAIAGIAGSRLGEEIGDFVAGPIGRTIGGVAGGLLLGATDGFINGRNIKNLTSAERKIAENSGKLDIKNLFDTPEHRGVSNLVISDPNDVNFVLKKSSKGYTLEELDNIIKNNETLNKYSFILPNEHVETITGEDGLLYPIWKQLKIETYGREAPFGADHKLLLGEALEALRAKSNAIVNAVRLLALNQGLLLLDGRILTPDGLIKDFGEFHNVGITPNGKPVIFDGLLDTNSKLINITPENASSITPAQWTAAQDAAIARGDIAEAQRLRDLHFVTNAPNTVVKNVDGTPAHVYHGTFNKGWNSYDKRKFGTSTDNGMYGEGLYATSDRSYADVYARGTNADGKYIGEVKDLYINGEHPFYIFNKKDLSPKEIVNREDAAYQFGRTLKVQDDIPTPIWDEMNSSDIVIETKGTKRPNFAEIVVPRGEQIKSADAVTFDDNGIRIPLGLRDNFNINDIRYGIAPLLLGGIGAGLYEEKGNNYRNIR